MGLQQPGNRPLKRGDLFRGSILLGFCGTRFPLKCKDVKDVALVVLFRNSFADFERSESRDRGRDAATADQRSTCDFRQSISLISFCENG